MKGIILAGGSGSRLSPLTIATNKQLLPVYDKPIIYYPLSILMGIGIREILIISNPESIPSIEKLLGDGSKLGIKLRYCVQDKPRGLADAFILGEHFIDKDNVCLILGDNIFFGNNLFDTLKSGINKNKIFAYEVSDPSRYGVVEFDNHGNIISIEEKPKKPKSSFAIPGIYFFDNRVSECAKNLKPSPRGELEITDIMRFYLEKSDLSVSVFGRGIAWLDVGTHESLQEAANFVSIIQRRQGVMIACLEEIAFFMGFITLDSLKKVCSETGKSTYREYLEKLIKRIESDD